MSNVYDHDDYYSSPKPANPPAPPPPAPPRHEPMKEYDTYPLHNIDTHAATGPQYPPSPFDHQHQQQQQQLRNTSMDEPSVGAWHNPRGSMSDMKLTGRYDSDDEDDFGPVPREVRRRRTCMDKLCCGCCTCCPIWLRWCSCIFLLLIIGLGIAVGVLAAMFKKPDVKFTGLQGEPTVNLQQDNLQMNFTLGISVNNPNVESITFSTIVAKAYYPGHRDLLLGGGEKDNVKIESNAITNITFPFGLSVNIKDQAYQSVVNDILTKCGVFGGQKQSITVDYDVTPTVRIIGIPISPTISNQASFPCPLQDGDLAALGGGALSSFLPGGASGASSP
ncbi:hypothetical protein EC973_003797 [Apophysomyces ossiformis]|uniref:Late embryogenesis abundant protein LEA-2 subgroup domain-containing protein n=1 Tax=Apophysomyces ossiformis TaxID=679940 RepID=A0A8H7ESQ1_9FUNG|nr:hypothetical protein EC973_003797 [Apophysomyces ossiformis]